MIVMCHSHVSTAILASRCRVDYRTSNTEHYSEIRCRGCETAVHISGCSSFVETRKHSGRLPFGCCCCCCCRLIRYDAAPPINTVLSHPTLLVIPAYHTRAYLTHNSHSTPILFLSSSFM